MRIVSDEVLKNGIKEGIKQGMFGVGDIEDGKLICRHFKNDYTPQLVEGEILIKADLCKLPFESSKAAGEVPSSVGGGPETGVTISSEKDSYSTIHLRLEAPTGKISDVVRMIPYLKSKFGQVKVKVEISAENGNITISDYQDKIKEAIKQAELNVEEEKVD